MFVEHVALYLAVGAAVTAAVKGDDFLRGGHGIALVDTVLGIVLWPLAIVLRVVRRRKW